MEMIREYVVKVTDSFVPNAFQQFENEWSPEQEIVRCKDCTYWEEHYKWVRPEGGSFIAPRCNRLMKKTRSNWFCADGERIRKVGEVE